MASSNNQNNVKSAVAFMVLTSLTILTRTSDEGFYSAVLSSLETRFQLKTFQLALVQTVSSVSSFTTVLILGYFSDFSHKPYIITFVGLLTAAGTLLQAMPRFLHESSPPLLLSVEEDVEHSVGKSSSDWICLSRDDRNRNISRECTDEDSNISGALWNQVWWILVGKLVQSFGQELTPILAITYVDDSPCSRFIPAFLGECFFYIFFLMFFFSVLSFSHSKSWTFPFFFNSLSAKYVETATVI